MDIDFFSVPRVDVLMLMLLSARGLLWVHAVR